jgi:hypothetical protein
MDPRQRCRRAMGAGCGVLAYAVAIAAGLAAHQTREQAAAEQTSSEQIAALRSEIAGREAEPAERVFTNIQLFKGMPAGRVLLIMERAFVPNLGVECSHCHVEGEWASDAKAVKEVARGMWTLRADTQEQVRKISGSAQAVVTCYTCHKGQPKPAFELDR